MTAPLDLAAPQLHERIAALVDATVRRSNANLETLADRVGISYVTVYHAVRGHFTPQEYTLCAIARMAGVTPETLLRGVALSERARRRFAGYLENGRGAHHETR